VTARDFWRLYREVYRRRWLVIAICGTTLAVVGLGCAFMPRYYRASAFVMPSEAALSKPVIPGTTTAEEAGSRQVDPRRKEELMSTFIGLAQTADVRERAITSLGLAMTSSQLEEFVKVEPAAGTIIKITCLARTARGSVDLANAIAHEFAGYYQEITSKQAERNREFLEKELAAAAAEMEAAKADLQQFKSSQAEAALPVGTAENPFLTQFYAQRSEMDATRSKLREVEGRLRAVRAELRGQPKMRETETSTTDNPVTRELQSRLAELERDLLLARSRYTDKHRKVKDLETQIADVRDRLAREADKMVTLRTVQPNPVYQRLEDQAVELEAEAKALSARLASLAAAMADNERRAGELADTSVALIAKTREYDNAEAKHARLQAMLDAAKMEEKVSSSAGEIVVVDQARSAVGPVTKKGPSIWQLLLLGTVLSVGLGIGTALGLAFLDDRVRGSEDVQRELQLPVPAVIPELTAGTNGVPLALITELQPLSAHAEAYRFLRTELIHQNGGPPVRTLMIATAKPRQGGSTTAVNLAIALAEIGKRDVLVDADMRRPCLHEFFGEPNDAGLTTLLANGSDGAARALRRTTQENLLLLPAGPPVGNPAALLSSEQMRVVLEKLRQNADYVIVDTPSAAAFADAALVGPLVDGVILVMRANQPVRNAEVRTKELLTKVGANVIGAVLNQAPAETVDSYYFHSHYYPNGPVPPAVSRASGGPTAALEPPVRTAAAASVGDAVDAAGPRDVEEPVVEPTATDAADAEGEHARAQAVARPQGRRRGLGTLLGGLGALVASLALLVYFGLIPTTAPHDSRAAARPASGAGPVAAPEAAVTVVAVIRQATEVRVETDGRLLYEGILTGGQQVWKGSREVTIWASRPEAIEVTVNDKALGPLGNAGDPPVTRRFSSSEEPTQ
jgi:capsular exopolysaccharide synthesis family protein